MPFENHGNRSFTMVSVDKNAPPASGVYGLANANRWIFLGETANIQADLFQHLNHPSAFLKEHAPSGFTFELSTEESRTLRLRQLVLELDPIGNAGKGTLSR